MRFKQPHTSCWKGKTVVILKRDGSKVVDKFMDRKSKYILLQKYGKIYNNEIRSFIIRKNQKERRKENDFCRL